MSESTELVQDQSDTKEITQEYKRKGTTSKATLQSYIQNFCMEAVDGIVNLMRYSRNENLKFGAMKLIIERSIPQVTEVTGQNGQQLILNLLSGGYFPPNPTITTTPATSDISGQSEVQGSGVAQTGKEDNNSNNGVSETSPH